MSEQMALSEYQTELGAAKENLKHLTGGTAEGDASGVVIRERTFRLPRFLPGTETAINVDKAASRAAARKAAAVTDLVIPD